MYQAHFLILHSPVAYLALACPMIAHSWLMPRFLVEMGILHTSQCVPDAVTYVRVMSLLQYGLSQVSSVYFRAEEVGCMAD